MKYCILWVTLFLAGCRLISVGHQRYENLGNPTEYLFSAPSSNVIAILQEKHGPKSWGPMGAGFRRNSVYGLGIYSYYSKRYWTGAQEKREDIDPPEAGQIGTIQANFDVHVVSKGSNQTLVSVSVDSFEQQVGRRYDVFPHFRKVPVYSDVKSDTYFEYLFLSKLGELLGEKSMPPIKGESD